MLHYNALYRYAFAYDLFKLGYTRTCFCNGKMMIKHSTVRHTWCLMVSVFPDGMNDYDVFTKTCIKLWPRYLPRRTKTRSKLGDPQTMQNRLHRWTSRGPPFWDAKMVQKQQFLIRVLMKNNWPEILQF